MDAVAVCGGSLAGSGPAARLLFLLAQEKWPKEGHPAAPPLRGRPRLNRSTGAAAQLALRAQTVLAEFPRRLDPVAVAQKGETGVLRW